MSSQDVNQSRTNCPLLHQLLHQCCAIETSVLFYWVINGNYVLLVGLVSEDRFLSFSFRWT